MELYCGLGWVLREAGWGGRGGGECVCVGGGDDRGLVVIASNWVNVLSTAHDHVRTITVDNMEKAGVNMDRGWWYQYFDGRKRIQTLIDNMSIQKRDTKTHSRLFTSAENSAI